MNIFKKLIAYLIFDLNWEWLEQFIEFLCDTEMALKRKFNPYLAERKLSENMEKIPKGYYCYSGCLYCPEGIQICPFYDKSSIANFFYGYQSNGYCHYLKKGDYTTKESSFLLWDMCKECSLNYEDE